jgi:signal transduction histidine kinase
MPSLLTQHLKALESSALLKGLKAGTLETFVGLLKTKSFPENAWVIHEGSQDSDLYFILEGKLRVFKQDPQNQEVELNQLNTGDFFGELSILDNLPRSASVKTLSPTLLACLSRDQFIEFSRQIPDVLTKILQEISLRFRKSNQTFFENILQKNRELEQAYTQLKTLDEQKSKFIALTSHEIRTPLTIMLGGLQLAQSGALGQIDPKAQKMMILSYNSATRLKTIVDCIVDVAVNNNLEAFLTKEPLRLKQLVQEVLEDLSILLIKRKLSFSTEMNTDPELRADRTKMKQVFTHLIMNAVRFTPDGGTIKIWSTQPTPSTLQIHVQDTGIGIPKDKLSLIFSPFYKIGAVESHTSGDVEFGSGGIGLGLTIAKNFVELHDGTIEVRSELDKGSDFVVSIPLGRPIPASAQGRSV